MIDLVIEMIDLVIKNDDAALPLALAEVANICKGYWGGGAECETLSTIPDTIKLVGIPQRPCALSCPARPDSTSLREGISGIISHGDTEDAKATEGNPDVGCG